MGRETAEPVVCSAEELGIWQGYPVRWVGNQRTCLMAEILWSQYKYNLRQGHRARRRR